MRPAPHARSLLAAAALALSACEDPIGETQPPETTPETTTTFADAGVRRLSNPEYDAAILDLLGLDAHASQGFAVDVRQSHFTANFEQSVDETLGTQLQVAAHDLAEQAVTTQYDKVVPCDMATPDCPRQFVSTFAERAFRRPVTDEEVTALLAVFDAALKTAAPPRGAQAVIELSCNRRPFLYIPELGAGIGTTRELTLYEAASVLSFMIMGAPPDAELLDAAASSELATPDQREAQARRLLRDDPRARAHLVRFFREWLSLDTLMAVAREPATTFESVRLSLDQETAAFVDYVLFQSDGSLKTLLTADFTAADPTLASYYGVQASDQDTMSLGETPRRGLLAQGAFLATHAREDESSPVRRGVAVVRQLFCKSIEFPTDPAIAQQAMTTPEPSSTTTTRARFEEHANNPACSGCHSRIDPIGFAFEEFDQIGQYRADENGFPIDPSGELHGTDVDGPFANVGELVDRLADSDEVKQCFARNILRFSAARTSPELEDSFLARWAELPAPAQTNLVEAIVAFVRSDMFAQRSFQ
ncbi:MAG: DUF1592 domain-containing protein [Polyangiaceae bacterium]